MKLIFVLHLSIIFSLTPVQMKSIASDGANIEKPRVFFRQLIEASGLFPLEINVQDTVSSMMGGLSAAYNAMSMYFGNTGGEESEGQSQQEVTAIKRDQRKKKTKRKKKINYEKLLKLYYVMS